MGNAEKILQDIEELISTPSLTSFGKKLRLRKFYKNLRTIEDTTPMIRTATEGICFEQLIDAHNFMDRLLPVCAIAKMMRVAKIYKSDILPKTAKLRRYISKNQLTAILPQIDAVEDCLKLKKDILDCALRQCDRVILKKAVEQNEKPFLPI